MSKDEDTNDDQLNALLDVSVPEDLDINWELFRPNDEWTLPDDETLVVDKWYVAIDKENLYTEVPTPTCDRLADLGINPVMTSWSTFG